MDLPASCLYYEEFVFHFFFFFLNQIQNPQIFEVGNNSSRTVKCVLAFRAQALPEITISKTGFLSSYGKDNMPRHLSRKMTGYMEDQ